MAGQGGVAVSGVISRLLYIVLRVFRLSDFLFMHLHSEHSEHSMGEEGGLDTIFILGRTTAHS
jgi:hypothetical protein